MDSNRFDDLARGLAVGTSRRGVIRGLLGGAFATAVTALGLEEAAAACGLIGQRCSANAACCAGAKCRNGRCRCKTGQGFRACNGPNTKCVDTNASEKHCGTCGTACATGATCEAGVCTCPSGTEVCGGACVNTSERYCGACGNACPTGQVCGELFDGTSACCFPPGTEGVCTASNYQTVCCASGGNVGCGSPVGRCFV